MLPNKFIRLDVQFVGRHARAYEGFHVVERISYDQIGFAHALNLFLVF